MDGIGDQLLAGAGLALDEHRGVRRRDAADDLVDLLHGGRAPDHQLVPLLELAAQAFQVPGETAERQRPGDQCAHLLEVERLGQVVVRAALRGLDGVRHRVLRGHDDEDRVDALLSRA